MKALEIVDLIGLALVLIGLALVEWTDAPGQILVFIGLPIITVTTIISFRHLISEDQTKRSN